MKYVNRVGLIAAAAVISAVAVAQTSAPAKSAADAKVAIEARHAGRVGGDAHLGLGGRCGVWTGAGYEHAQRGEGGGQ